MSEYIFELRRVWGSGPLLVCGAAAIIVDGEGRVLLHHRRDNDTWGLPSGAAELGERLEDCVKRDVQEEVGLMCGALELLGVYSGPELYHRYPNGDEAHNVSVVYVCREFSGEMRVDPAEGKEARFFAVEDIPEEINPPMRPVIEDVRRRWSEVVGGT